MLESTNHTTKTSYGAFELLYASGLGLFASVWRM
jgi:hypothetical protein